MGDTPAPRWWLSDPALANDIGGRFDHVMVDEYQDTNRLQSSILLALKPHGRGLTVVGDDAQSIYSFRAATVRNILDFPAAFSPPAEIVTIDRNYRSTQAILSAANGVIGLAAERFTKDLWTERKSGTPPQLVSVRDEADQARATLPGPLAAAPTCKHYSRARLNRSSTGTPSILSTMSRHSRECKKERARGELSTQPRGLFLPPPAPF
jgi:hypothetical protein